MDIVIDLFNSSFFVIVGGVTTVLTIAALGYSLCLWVKGIFPVWYRLGISLSKRKIAIFANSEFDNLKNILVDSGLFSEKNIIRVDPNSIKKATTCTLLLIHWESFESRIDEILKIKKDSDALIIYAPSSEGQISPDALKLINEERNSTIVNFRGRLLNDILTNMITTGYEKK